MFDIGWTEMLVVAVVMILVVGPKELPGMLRTIGKSVGNLKRLAGDFQRQFSDALRESELDEMKNDLTSDIKEATSVINPLDDINASADEMLQSLNADEDLVDDEIAADVLAGKTAVAPTDTKTTKKPVKRRAAKSTTTKTKLVKKGAVKKPVANKPVVKKTAAKKRVAAKSTIKPVPRRKPAPGGKTT